tara:strand:+ start:31754 stop:32008 length:255 start_codon:yes stop_codon:yes gene_type:complete
MCGVFLFKGFFLKAYGKASAVLAVRFAPAVELIFPYAFKKNPLKRKTGLELCLRKQTAVLIKIAHTTPIFYGAFRYLVGFEITF